MATPIPYISTSRPLPAVMLVKVPFLLLRYSADRDLRPRGVQSLLLTSRMSGQPSPSASKKAQPEPSVSGRYFLPARPLLWVKWMPACAVTSVNTGPAGGAKAKSISRKDAKLAKNIRNAKKTGAFLRAFAWWREIFIFPVTSVNTGPAGSAKAKSISRKDAKLAKNIRNAKKTGAFLGAFASWREILIFPV